MRTLYARPLRARGLEAIALFAALTFVHPARQAAASWMLYATAASQNRVDGFCVRDSGRLLARRRVARKTKSAPRRLLVAGDMLYVLEPARVEAFRIGPRGGLSRDSATAAERGASNLDFVLDPQRAVLYVSQPGLSRIVAYKLGPQGSLPRELSSCAQGELNVAYRYLALGTDRLFATAILFGKRRGRIDAFDLAEDGSLLPATNCGLDGQEELPMSTTPAVSYTKMHGAAALVLEGDRLYVAERGRGRLAVFDTELAPHGHTRRVASYQRILVHDGVLFGTVFGKGRIDAYVLEPDGTLPRRPTRHTRKNLFRTPVGLAALGQVLFVAAGSLDRVEAYRISARRGFKWARPVRRTQKLNGSFPNDVALARLRGKCKR